MRVEELRRNLGGVVCGGKGEGGRCGKAGGTWGGNVGGMGGGFHGHNCADLPMNKTDSIFFHHHA